MGIWKVACIVFSEELKRLINENPGDKKVILSFLGSGQDINLKQRINWTKTLSNDIALILNSVKN